MYRNTSVAVDRFSMVPRADIPRSKFLIESMHKTTFDGGKLIPVYYEEVLPGDHLQLNSTFFARLATPLFPVMDNLHLDSFIFFVPNRLLWTNWRKFMGEQDNPGDSISFTIPQIVSPVGGWAVGSLQDYLGWPTVGQVGGGNTVTQAAFATRGYNLIYNEWFRDQNLQNSVTVDKGDGPDTAANYVLLSRGKRHDYFTSALPSPQKGLAVTIPLGTSATVRTNSTDLVTGAQTNAMRMRTTAAGALPANNQVLVFDTSGNVNNSTAGAVAPGQPMYPSNLYADLSTATAASINLFRQAFQIQKLLERDARGGTRYTEIIRQHFGVISPDARLQRPEYLGGGSTPIAIAPVAQTSGTGASGTTTPAGTLNAIGQVVSQTAHCSQSFTEHGHVYVLVSVRADLSYQQGLRRMFSRLTRYDFYFPAFAMLGEQAILNKEIYADGSANDANVFGYQERWGELRYSPSKITGLFRSTSAGTIDPWHLAQKFTALPTLNSTFITDAPPISRVVAVGASANGQQLIFDAKFTAVWTRPLPMFSVPGLIDHF